MDVVGGSCGAAVAHHLRVELGGDVLAVLLMLVTAGLPGGVGDRRHQTGGPLAELPCSHRESSLPAAAGGDAAGVVSTASCSRAAHAISGSVTR